MIYVAVGVETTSGAQSCSLTGDSSSNSYTPLNFTSTGSSVGLRHYYKFSPTVSSAMTWTVGGTNCFSPITVIVAKGTHNVLDKQSTSGLYTGTSVTTYNVCDTTICNGGSSMSPAQAGELAIAVIMFDANYGSGGCTVNQGFSTPVFTPYSTGNNYGGCAAYLVASSTAALGPSFSWVTATTSFPTALVFFE